MRAWKLLGGWCLAIAALPASAVGSLMDVTVYDRTEQRVLAVHQHQGRYYVVGKPGNEYQINVRNATGDDVLGVVSVDGVNVVTGETASWEQGGYVLRPSSPFGIRGWRKSLSRVAAFYFTEHENSYAARTGRPDHVGVIGVAVFRKRPEPVAIAPPVSIPRPVPYQRNEAAGRAQESGPRADEAAAGEPTRSASAPAAAAGSSAAKAATADTAGERPLSPEARDRRLGTGHGRNETSHVQSTTFERASPGPAEVITIHYDTHRNLVAMGVLRPDRRLAEVPNPFPGRFVPDPN